MFKKVLIAEDFQDTNMGIVDTLQERLAIAALFRAASVACFCLASSLRSVFWIILDIFMRLLEGPLLGLGGVLGLAAAAATADVAEEENVSSAEVVCNAGKLSARTLEACP